MKRIHIFFAIFLTTILSAKAQFGGGDGTQINPFLINTVKHLAALGDSVNSGKSYTNQYFRLTTNLNLADWCASHASTGGWEPIGGKINNVEYYFGGHFNGAGYEIRNLHMNRVTDYQGLFGCVSGSIDSLGVTAINITATSIVDNSNNGVGGLAGKSNLANIQNCYATGTIKGNYCVGGLVGAQSKGIIQNCYTIASITGNLAIGGLVGHANDKDGKIQNCYTNCVINGINSVGGLVGSSCETIQNCYAIGNITGNNDVGGLVGRNFDKGGIIRQCYTTGVIKGKGNIGGIAGSHKGGDSIIQCVAANTSINATDSNVYRIVGQKIPIAIVANCYALESMVVNGNIVNCSNPDSLHGADKSLTELYQQSTYEGLSWDFTSGTGNWKMGKTDHFPVLAWQSYQSDAIPPTIINIEIISDSTIKLTFDELLNDSIAEKTTNYVINGGLAVSAAMLSAIEVVLILNPVMAEGNTYTLTVKNIQDKDGNIMPDSTLNFDFGVPFANWVSNIGELKEKMLLDNNEKTVGTITYKLTGEVIVTALNNAKQKWIQDATGAVVINDPDEIIFITLNIGDKVKNIYGTLTNYHGLLQFIPTKNIDSVISFSNLVTPLEITTQQLKDVNYMVNHQSELMKLSNVAFADADGFYRFNPRTKYLLEPRTTTDSLIYVDTYEHNYVYDAVPADLGNITGVNTFLDEKYLLIPRLRSDFEFNIIMASSISLNQDTIRLEKNNNETLLATVLPTNATDRNVKWSSQSYVASVLQGQVFANIVGQTYVFASTTDGSLKDSCLVIVTDSTSMVHPTGVSLNKNILSLKVDSTKTLKAVITPNDATNPNLIWESRDENIVTVDNNGLLKGITLSSTYIVVTTEDEGYQDSCFVKVTEPSHIDVTGISLDKQILSLKIDSTATLTATVFPDSATNQNVIWESKDANIATVDNDGLITGIAAGSVYIFATAQDIGYRTACLVTVKADDIPVTGVTLDAHALSIKVDSIKTLVATISPSNATDQNITWESSDENIATVNNNGLVTAIAIGNTYIVVTTQDGEFQDSCLVTVTENTNIAVSGVTLDNHTLSLKVDSTKILVATISPNNATNQNVTWESRDETIATVNNNGLVTAIAKGETYIVVITEDGNYKDSCLVTIESNVGIDGIENHTIAFKIYPNPTSGKLIIENGILPTKTAELFDLNGRLITTFNITDKKTEIDISHLPNGTYVIKLGNEITKVVKK